MKLTFVKIVLKELKCGFNFLESRLEDEKLKDNIQIELNFIRFSNNFIILL